MYTQGLKPLKAGWYRFYGLLSHLVRKKGQKGGSNKHFSSIQTKLECKCNDLSEIVPSGSILKQKGRL